VVNVITDQVELPDKLAEVLDTLVQQGWFRSEAKILRFALLEFLRRQHLALHEQFQRDDIAWALRQKDAVEWDGSSRTPVRCSICTKLHASTCWSTLERSRFPRRWITKWSSRYGSGTPAHPSGSR
jgi:Arc/MetJ-type ribon-helix-helix transcriptional regulator